MSLRRMNTAQQAYKQDEIQWESTVFYKGKLSDTWICWQNA